MFDIFHIIGKNIAEGPGTISLPRKTPPPIGYRGLVLLDPKRCIGCGLCAYVCVSESVTGSSTETEYHWQYEPGRCTFCARCVDRCPADALSMSADSPPIYSHHGELNVEHTIPFPKCKECGKPTRLPPEILLHWADAHVDPETRNLYSLCEGCKRLHYQTAMKSMLEGAPKENQV